MRAYKNVGINKIFSTDSYCKSYYFIICFLAPISVCSCKFVLQATTPLFHLKTSFYCRCFKCQAVCLHSQSFPLSPGREVYVQQKSRSKKRLSVLLGIKLVFFTTIFFLSAFVSVFTFPFSIFIVMCQTHFSFFFGTTHIVAHFSTLVFGHFSTF